MRAVKLRGFDRIVPRIIYRIDKIGLKLHNKRILNISNKLVRYIGHKYGAPKNQRWMMGMDYIEY